MKHITSPVTDDWVMIKLKEPAKVEEMTSDEILKSYCDAIDNGDHARITKLRERVDVWREKYYPKSAANQVSGHIPNGQASREKKNFSKS